MNRREYWAKPNETLQEHVDRLIQELERMHQCHCMDEKTYELVKRACIHHDDGKVNAVFQTRVKDGKIRFNSEKEVPHNVLSAFLLDRGEFEDKEDFYKVLFAVLYHHNYGNPMEIINEKKQLIDRLLGDFQTYQLDMEDRCYIQDMILDLEAIKVKGFLHKCDYSASGGYISEYPNNFLISSLENVKQKWIQQNPDSDWNELQRFCMEKRDKNIMVVAQTGMGKTEAGLQWIGDNKGYFVLPLRTAINAIYDRVKDEILLGEKLNIRLAILHSESLDYYSKHLNQDLDLVEYEKRGKNLSMPLNISTMDQLFDFIFKYQGYELKMATFSYSRIVIDEIQMYDPELLRFLIYGLRCITQMGGKVAIMTATLSPFVKELLMREIPFEEECIRTFVDDTLRHHVHTKDCMMNAEDILDLYRKNEQLGKSNKILVVCNTVKKAQQLYQEVEQLMQASSEDTSKLYILHSRFIRRDRARKEQEIREFGKTFNEEGQLDHQSCIWFSTSLVEASLDIDFDYLFTELQDLNSLFQRMGRCNRKGKKDITEVNCYVYTEIEPEYLANDKNGLIDKAIFELSKTAIVEGNGLLTEAKKLELINEYLTMKNLRRSSYYKKYKKADEIEHITPYQFEKGENKLRNILTRTVIPSPIYEREKEGILEAAEKSVDKELDYMERLKWKEELMEYTVSIPYYVWMEYQKAVNKGTALSYPSISLKYNEAIPVVESSYDRLGFKNLGFKRVIRDANIW